MRGLLPDDVRLASAKREDVRVAEFTACVAAAVRRPGDDNSLRYPAGKARARQLQLAALRRGVEARTRQAESRN